MPRILARALSIIGHPCALALVDAAAVGARTLRPAEATRLVLVVVAAVLVPLAAFVAWQVRRGRWSDVDASRPGDRPSLFAFALIVLGGLTVWLVLAGAPPLLPRGVAGACLLVLVARFALRRVKLSLHLAFATYSATVLAFVWPEVAVGLAALLPPLAWARWSLRRHTGVEIAAGGVAGLLVALAVAAV